MTSRPSPRSFFLSSTYGGLADERHALLQWAARSDIDMWGFERVPSEWWQGRTSGEKLEACLSKMEERDVYVGVFRSDYGTSALEHRARVGFTDLELFHAVRTDKQTVLYIIEADARHAQLRALLRVVAGLFPHAIRAVGSWKEVFPIVKSDVLRLAEGHSLSHPSTGEVRGYLEQTVNLRWDTIVSTVAPNALPQGTDTCQDISVADTGVYRDRIAAALEASQELREITLSELIAELHEVPWSWRTSNLLRVWDEALQAWFESVVWHDSHNSELFGCLGSMTGRFRVCSALAMERELIVLRDALDTMTSEPIGADEWRELYKMCSGMGSVYYSLGKALTMGDQREFLLRSAYSWAKAGQGWGDHILKRDPEPELVRWRSHSAAILGYICLSLPGRFDEALQEFKVSLELKQRIGDDIGSIGEAQADLGYALWKSGAHLRGCRMLEEGVAKLMTTQRSGFIARKKLLLAEVYLRSGKLRDAVRQVAEADAVCQCDGVKLRQPPTPRARAALSILRVTADRLRLRAHVGPKGYAFEQRSRNAD